MDPSNGARLILSYDGKDLQIQGGGTPASLAVWMLEAAKASIISGAGRPHGTQIKGLDLSPLNPRKLE